MSRWILATALAASLLTVSPLATGAEGAAEAREQGRRQVTAPRREPPPPDEAAPGDEQHHHHAGDGQDAPRADATSESQRGSGMDHSQMDHSRMGHGERSQPEEADEHTIEPSRATAPVAPYFVSPEMERARAEARREMGGGRVWMVEGERLEWRSGEGAATGWLEGQAWYGGDMNRLRVKIDAELLIDPPRGTEQLASAQIQALYSRPVGAFFDLQAGVRHDVEPSPSRTFAVVGVHGLAPQWLEVDVALFLSEDGDLSSRLEVEYEMLLTQRLVLELHSELDLMAGDVPELGLGSGLSSVEAGVRLGYGRLFGPYVGVSWEGKRGRTARFARAAGEDTSSLSAVVGLRFWR